MACLNSSIRSSGNFSQFLFNNCFMYTDTYKYHMATTKPWQHCVSPPAILSRVPRTEPSMAFDTHANSDTKALNLQRLFLYSSQSLLWSSLGIQFAVKCKRDFFFLRNCVLTCPLSWDLFRTPEHRILLAQSSREAAPFSLPASGRPCTFCFVIKCICIGYTFKFFSNHLTVLSTDICICMITYHHFTVGRKKSPSSPVLVLLSKGCPFSWFFSFIIHRWCQTFCCIVSPKLFFLNLEYRQFSINIIVLSLLTKPGFFFFFFLADNSCLLVLSQTLANWLWKFFTLAHLETRCCCVFSSLYPFLRQMLLFLPWDFT